MKKILFTLIATLLLAGGVWAQGCVTCTNTAAQLGQDSAKGLNIGILYLMSIPFCLVGAVSFILYRKHKALEKAEG